MYITKKTPYNLEINMKSQTHKHKTQSNVLSWKPDGTTGLPINYVN